MPLEYLLTIAEHYGFAEVVMAYILINLTTRR